MLFSCPECTTKYKIDDEKIFKKVLKFKCRTCGNSLIIRDPSLGKPYVCVESEFVQGKLYRRITESSSEIAKKFERKPISEIKPIPSLPPPSPLQTKVRDLWYLIRKGEKIGPLSSEKIEEMYFCGEIHERTFVWKPQMKGWTRLKEVSELIPIIAKKKTIEAEKTVVDEKIRETMKEFEKKKQIPKRPSGEILPPPQRIETKQLEVVDDLWKYLKEPEKLIKEATKIQKEEKEKDKISETPIEKKFFSSVFALSEAAPSKIEEKFFPEISLTEEKTEDREILKMEDLSPVKPLKVKKPSKKEIKSLIQEFSVMIRLERKTKKQKILFATIGVLLVIGITYAVIQIQRESKLRSREIAEGYRTEGYKYKKLKRGIYEIENEEEGVEREDEGVEKGIEKKIPKLRQNIQIKKNNNNAPSIIHRKEKNHINIAPKLKEEYEFYSDISKDLALKEDEIKLDFKPKTVEKKDTSTLTPEGINEFLSQKFKKFTDCKRRSKYKSPYPVKIIFTFTVNSDGRVGDVLIEEESGMKDEVLNLCLKNLVHSWIFPSIEKPITFKRILML